MSSKHGDWEFADGRWMHRPWWKVAINTALRAVQRKRSKKLVIATISTQLGSPPRVLGYKLAFVEHKPPPSRFKVAPGERVDLPPKAK